jgi:hypothetical protein
VDKIIILMTDGAAIVRASACRTLGLYVLYKPIYENSQIMSRVAKCFVDGTGDKNLNVRIKAAWSLANYCDALIKSTTTTESTKIQVPDNLLFALFQASLKAALDNDKVYQWNRINIIIILQLSRFVQMEFELLVILQE